MIVNDFMRILPGWFTGPFKLGITMLATVLLCVTVTAAQSRCNGEMVCENDLSVLLDLEDAAGKTTASSAAVSGISISVDGEVVVGSPAVADRARRNDVKLEAVDIQVKFDGLDVTRRLNVSTHDMRVSFKPGENVKFVGSWNYPDWIDQAEIRIYRLSDKYAGEVIARPLEVIAMQVSGNKARQAEWQAFTRSDGRDEMDYNLVYSLRVYDEQGRFDETAPLALRLSEADDLPKTVNTIIAPGEGDDRTIVSGIPLYGGSVTVYGRHVPPGYQVTVMGEQIPVDEGQAFVTSRILPPGQHLVDVSVNGVTKDDGLHFERDINIPDEEWFYIGLADFTFGKRFGKDSKILHQTAPGKYSDTYQRGRLAFYLKGKIRGDTLITAALDTTEDDLDVMFSNLDEKDPRQLLRRLDSDDYYPVYGDDSTLIEDAPTSGRFYVRIERGKSHVLWGNFKTRIKGTELARFERGLYGAQAHLRSSDSTSFGEPVRELQAFAAQPGTLPQRDEMRGTGGSAYFLRRQDINQGSEQVVIEVRDRITGLTITRTILRPGEDYDLDYVQGVILLQQALASTTTSSSAVLDDSQGGNDQFLVVVYEYTPTLLDIDGFTYGGRVHAWLNDHVRIGATGFIEDTGIADQTLIGADVAIRLSENSYFEFEWAQSEGDTFATVISTDGGFIFNTLSGAGAMNGPSEAWRVKLAMDTGELFGEEHEGSIGAYFEQRDAGFNAPGRYTALDETIWGLYARLNLSEDVLLDVHYDEIVRNGNGAHREVDVEIEHQIDQEWSIRTGIQHSEITSAIGTTTGTGKRTDLGIRVTRDLGDGTRNWVFGQLTLDRDGSRKRNDRIGVGGEKDITDKVSVSGEVSYGTIGIGALAAINYHPNVTDKYYIGYRLQPDSTAGDFNGYDPFGSDFGSVVYGNNRRINDRLTAFMEENYDFSGSQRSLTHTYGVTYTPDNIWSVSGGLEAGEIYDAVNGDFDRVAVSGTLAYKDEGKTGSIRLEARFEDGIDDATRDRKTYLVTSQLGLLQDDDWRFIAKIDALISESNQDAVLDGDYIEASLGWAYRPVENDRLNALFKYTYLHDLPGAQQVNANNVLLGPKQRSHILSADFIYDVNEILSVGVKYGIRVGEVSLNRDDHDFSRSTAQLAIGRFDIHVVHNWDIILEARALWLKELEQVNFGTLAGVYRHIGDNLKIGVGYNFSQFSDDLSDLTYDDEGVFINVVGKF